MKTDSRKVQMMGATIELTVQDDFPDLILDEMLISLEEYEKRFSAHDPASELMEVNKNAGIRPVRVHAELYDLIKIGKNHSLPADSALNITIGPLVQAWRIGFKDAHLPNDDDIQSLLRITHPNDIILDDAAHTVFLTKRGMFIDLGALAKGYIADLLVGNLQIMDVPSALINLGGNVMTHGKAAKHVDGYFRIGIQHPFLSRGNYIALLKVFQQSVVTSGIYERKFTVGGKTYHHILDRHTGYPIETDVAGLTIVSDKSVDGEIWTGRLFGKSPDQVMEILSHEQGIYAIIITRDGELTFSEELKPFLTIL